MEANVGLSASKDRIAMVNSAELRRQHDDASQLITGITGQLGDYRGTDDAYRLTLGMAQLLSLLRVHLSREDEQLYPAMIRSGDRRTAATARRFANEIGGFAEHLEEFAMRWSSSAVISARFDEFREETLAIFATLETRIRRENQQLYPLADRLAAKQLRTAA